jgi:phospholipase C
VDRRTFLKTAAAGVGLAALGPGRALAGPSPVNLTLPSLGVVRPQARTPVEHLVVVMMENRSLDHLLGWYGAENADFDGRQDATFVDLRQGPDGPPISTEPWGARGRGNYHGRGFEDPTHSWSGGRRDRNGGACDGWLDPANGNDELTLSTYDAVDVPVWAQLARGWQAYDRWFCSVLGGTQPNRYYLHSGQSAGLKNNDLPPDVAAEHPEWAAGWDWPTIWTLFDTYAVDAGYYFSNLPELAFWGPRHLHHCRHVSNFYADAAAGTLPQVSFIDPWFVQDGLPGNDDHPHADLRLGQSFLSDIVEAFTSSPLYEKGALVITYDEWGGFWEHVDPPRVADDRATDDDPGGDDDFGQLGFRIPSAIVSPWTRNTRGHHVDHTTYEHTSIIKFISDNWGLPYLTKRHAATTSIERAFRSFRRFDPEVDFSPYQADPLLLLEPPADAVGVESSDLALLAERGWFDGLGLDLDHTLADCYLRTPVRR